MALPPYAVTFRGKPACPCQVIWIPAYEHEAQRRGILPLGGTLTLYQLIGLYVKSGGVHARGGAGDYVDLPGGDDLWLMRQMGADASWLRPPNWDGSDGIKHCHSVLTGCPHLAQAAKDQIAAVRANGDGLVGPGADTGPRPLSGRTWREGIAWAKEQEENDVDEATIDKIATAAAAKVLATKIDLGDNGGNRDVEQILRELWNKSRRD